jgi:hypothetical protein
VKRFKLVYPNLTNKNSGKKSDMSLADSMDTSFRDKMLATTSGLSLGSLASGSTSGESKFRAKQKLVPTYIAPPTMFQKNKGLNNAGLVEEVFLLFARCFLSFFLSFAFIL